MRTITLCLLSCIALFAAACGSSSSTTPATTTRTLTGKVVMRAAPAAALSLALPQPAKAEVAGSCAEIDPPVCKVIATATDGTTVLDENLTDCAFSLPLVIGSDYVISFVGTDPATGTCTKFLATLINSGSSIFSIEDGALFDLGDISIDPATGEAIAEFLFDGLMSCAELSSTDTDSDDICDDWEEEFPEEWGDTGSSGGDDGVSVDDLAGTYELTAVNGTNGCDDDAAWAFSQTVTVAGGNVSIVDGQDAVNIFDNDEGAHPTADLLFAEAAGLFSRSDMTLADGCPLYDSKNTFVFDTTVEPFTLTRTFDELLAGGAGSDPIEGCEAVYTKQ